VDARIELELCRNKGDTRALLSVVMRLVARRCMISEAVISPAWIKDLFEQKKCAEHDMQAWQDFVDLLTYCAFTHKKDGEKAYGIYDRDVYDKVEQWITWLEKQRWL
jgi:hypothetical protein